jgi:tetratricopeptide (TPR) repeat protein
LNLQPSTVRRLAASGLWLFAMLGTLVPGVPAGDLRATAVQESPARTDEVAIQALVERLHRAIEAESLEEWTACWSAAAPGLADTQRLVNLRFRLADQRLLESRVSRIRLDGDRARLRVLTRFRVTDARSGSIQEAAAATALELVREADGWRIWKEGSAAAEAAEALAAAATDEERSARLADAREIAGPDLVRALVQQALGPYLGGEHARALVIYGMALTVAEWSGPREAIAAAHYNIANVQYVQGRLDAALTSYQKSLIESEAAGDRDGAASALLGIAVVHYARGDYDSSIAAHEKRLTLVESLGDRAAVATTLTNLGDVLYWQGRYRDALDRYRRALPMHRERDDRPEVARTLVGLGRVYGDLGDLSRALGSYQAGLALLETERDRAAIAAAVTGVGLISYRLGRHDAAAASFERARALEASMSNPGGVAESLMNLGLVDTTRGRFAEAIAFYSEALAIYVGQGERRGAAAARLGMGLAHGGRGEHDKALEFNRVALADYEGLGDEEGMARALVGTALARLGAFDPAAALAEASRAAGLATKVDVPETAWRARLAEGRARRLLGQTDLALRAFEESVTIIEEMRADPGRREPGVAGLHDEIDAPFLGLVDLLVATGRPVDALRFAERAKTQRLADALGPYRLAISTGLPIEDRRAEIAHADSVGSLAAQLGRARRARTRDVTRIRQLEAALAAARRARSDHRASLHRTYPTLEIHRLDDARIAPGELTELAASRTLLEYAVGDEATWVFVISTPPDSQDGQHRSSPAGPADAAQDSTPAGRPDRGPVEGPSAPAVVAFKIDIPRRDLTAHVLQLTSAIDRAAPDQAMLTVLADLLLGPVAGSLDRSGALVIVPDGILWRVPFELLPMPAGSDPGTPPARLSAPAPVDPVTATLGDTTDVSYAPSLDALRHMTRLARAAAPSDRVRGLLVVGAPAIDSTTAALVELGRGVPMTVVDDAIAREIAAVREAHAASPSPAVAADPGPVAGPQAAGVQVLEAGEATEDRVRQALAGIALAHIAAPVTIDDRSPMSSHIALASVASDAAADGLFELTELLDTPLGGELLVFSKADQVGVPADAGRGLMALSWTAFVAGCPAIIISRSSARVSVEEIRELHEALARSGAAPGRMDAATGAMPTRPAAKGASALRASRGVLILIGAW